MARKHNTKHDRRGPSHYNERLQDRGETNTTVRMKFYDKDGRKHDTMDSANRASGRKTATSAS